MSGPDAPIVRERFTKLATRTSQTIRGRGRCGVAPSRRTPTNVACKRGVRLSLLRSRNSRMNLFLWSSIGRWAPCVTNAGTFRLKHKLLSIANALKQHHIGLDETDDGIWSIYFGTVLLAKVDERDMIIRD